MRKINLLIVVLLLSGLVLVGAGCKKTGNSVDRESPPNEFETFHAVRDYCEDLEARGQSGPNVASAEDCIELLTNTVLSQDLKTAYVKWCTDKCVALSPAPQAEKMKTYCGGECEKMSADAVKFIDGVKKELKIK